MKWNSRGQLFIHENVWLLEKRIFFFWLFVFPIKYVGLGVKEFPAL
jgi:hypothetical protein